MEYTDFDQLSADEWDDKKKKERLAYLSRIPKYTKEDMESFARYYHGEVGNYPPAPMQMIFGDWEDENS